MEIEFETTVNAEKKREEMASFPPYSPLGLQGSAGRTGTKYPIDLAFVASSATMAIKGTGPFRCWTSK